MEPLTKYGDTSNIICPLRILVAARDLLVESDGRRLRSTRRCMQKDGASSEKNLTWTAFPWKNFGEHSLWIYLLHSM